MVTEGPNKAELFQQLSELSISLGRPRDAAQSLEEAVRHGANELQLLPRICELYEKAGRSSELTTALGRYYALADKAGNKELAAQLAQKRARVLESHMGDKTAAVKSYGAILEKRPSDPDALAALELLLGEPTCKEEAARALIPAYE